MRMDWIYLSLAIIGTIIPWGFFAAFFAANGIDPTAFVTGLFANGAAGGFSADIMISILVFWIWSFRDAKTLGIRLWWTVLPAGCFVGLSLALPWYLYLRERKSRRAAIMATAS